MQTPHQIDAYEAFDFAATTHKGDELSYTVYHRGEGKPVVLIQELPGIGQEMLRLADEFVEKGYQVFMPHLFGPIGKLSMGGNMVRVMCMRKAFSLFATNKSSPIVDWLKACCQHVRDLTQTSGVGVIGMCLTGNFAITLIGDDSVLAAVASQPAMPFSGQKHLHMSSEDIAAAKAAIDQKGAVQALRFEDDPLSTATKFKCFHEAFNDDGVERVQLKVMPGKGHSVLTTDFVNEAGHPTREALDQVFTYFDEKLV